MVSVSSEPTENKHPGNILVVDDIEESAKFFAEQLRAYFENVETASPERAERAIEVGKFGALVTDLRFVGNGRFDNGLALAQRLNGHCPPTVILTACVGTKTLSIITGQAVYTDGTPLLRGVMKGSGIEALVAQIRGAMADAERLPEGARAAGIKKVKIPEFNTGEAPAELTNVIALLSEKLKNYVRITRENLAVLKGKYNLEDWPSWKAIKATVEGQLEQFATFNSERLIGRSEKDTLDAMHELNSRVILLGMERLQAPKNSSKSEIMVTLRSLKNDYADIEGEIQSSFKKAEELCNPMMEFDRDVENIFSKSKTHLSIWYPSEKQKYKTHFRDRGRLVGSFFASIRDSFKGYDYSVDLRFMDEEELYWEGTEMHEKLQKKIEWGGGYCLRIKTRSKKDIGKTQDQWLDPIRSHIEKLVATKKIYIEPRYWSYVIDESDGGEIEIYLKTAELDKTALIKKQQEAAQIQTKKIGKMIVNDNRVNVDELSTPTGKIVVLGCQEPEKIKKIDGTWSGIFYNGELIMAHINRSHDSNEEAICHYLIKRHKIKLSTAFSTAQSAVRMKLSEGNLFVDYSKLSDEEMEGIRAYCQESNTTNRFDIIDATINNARNILPGAGIHQITLDPEEFCSRSGLTWYGVEGLGNAENSHESEDDEKDEWFE